ncbi:hypothetical protein LTR37_010716 [Vermiconidia calcicola]|uniref:Uncharacterized protein n=1 Tax=Vermiconidia calcicola TaxID=1690605 RepID=A0ACC3N442_9PEZI|nr:hypothetical protein LTR37_010716 [Vermiconidia calcicola]
MEERSAAQFNTLNTRVAEAQASSANDRNDATRRNQELNRRIAAMNEQRGGGEPFKKLVEVSDLHEKRLDDLKAKLESNESNTTTQLTSALQKEASCTAAADQVTVLQTQLEALRGQVNSSNGRLDDVIESVKWNAGRATENQKQLAAHCRESGKAVARCEHSLSELAGRLDEHADRPTDNMYTDGRINVLTSHLQRVDRRVIRNISQSAKRLCDLEEHLTRSEGRFADELGQVREDSSRLKSKVTDLDNEVRQTEEQVRRLATQRCQSIEGIVEESEIFRTEVRYKMEHIENTLESLRSRVEKVASERTPTSEAERSRIVREIGHLLQTAFDSPKSVVHPPAPAVATGSDNAQSASKALVQAVSPGQLGADMDHEGNFQPGVMQPSEKATAPDLLHNVEALVITSEVAPNGHQDEEREVADGDGAYEPTDHEESVQDPPRRSCRRRVAKRKFEQFRSWAEVLEGEGQNKRRMS